MRISALLLLWLTTGSTQDPPGKPLSICEVLKNRHQLVRREIIAVEGIDGGDGALRHQCAVSFEIAGAMRPAALWAEGAPDEFISRFRKRHPNALTFEEFASPGMRRFPKGVKTLQLVVHGYLELSNDDSATIDDPVPAFLGFGTLNVYPVMIRVAFVEVRPQAKK